MSELSNKALQKIGRNVVNLSKIEGMLKLFLSRVNFQCPINELKETLEAKKKKYETMTLGQVSQHYFKTYNFDTDPLHEYPEDRNEAWISFSYDTETASIENQQKDFDFLVEQRNKLIHEWLIEFNPESDDTCRSLIKSLDEQNEQIKIQYKHLQEKLFILHEGIKQWLLNHLRSNEKLNDYTINELLENAKLDSVKKPTKK